MYLPENACSLWPLNGRGHVTSGPAFAVEALRFLPRIDLDQFI
jgi:hypothetical protein